MRFGSQLHHFLARQQTQAGPFSSQSLSFLLRKMGGEENSSTHTHTHHLLGELTKAIGATPWKPRIRGECLSQRPWVSSRVMNPGLPVSFHPADFERLHLFL